MWAQQCYHKIFWDIVAYMSGIMYHEYGVVILLCSYFFKDIYAAARSRKIVGFSCFFLPPLFQTRQTETRNLYSGAQITRHSIAGEYICVLIDNIHYYATFNWIWVTCNLRYEFSCPLWVHFDQALFERIVWLDWSHFWKITLFMYNYNNQPH